MQVQVLGEIIMALIRSRGRVRVQVVGGGRVGDQRRGRDVGRGQVKAAQAVVVAAGQTAQVQVWV